MSREFKIEPVKSYANRENARKAVARAGLEGHRHFYMTCDEPGMHYNRWFPVFVGNTALDHGVHFLFNVIT